VFGFITLISYIYIYIYTWHNPCLFYSLQFRYWSGCPQTATISVSSRADWPEFWNSRLKVEIFQLGVKFAPPKTRRPEKMLRLYVDFAWDGQKMASLLVWMQHNPYVASSHGSGFERQQFRVKTDENEREASRYSPTLPVRTCSRPMTTVWTFMGPRAGGRRPPSWAPVSRASSPT